MKILKVLGIAVSVILVITVFFFAVEFTAYYEGSREMGYSKLDSYEYAIKILGEEYFEPMNNWIKNEIRKTEEPTEYSIPNWNISWNSLFREP